MEEANCRCNNCRTDKPITDFAIKKNGERYKLCANCIGLTRKYYGERKGKLCLWCKAPTNGTVYCDTHRAIIREQMREKRANRDARKCEGCGVDVGPFRRFCKECSRQRNLVCQRKWSKERVLEIYSRYGGAKCFCCGETTFEFLTLDHINDDGAEHRKLIGGSGSHVYSWIVRKNYPPGYRVLCLNCNAGRYRNGGICPHEEQRKTAAATA